MKLQAHPDVMARPIDDAFVLVHLKTDQIFELNGTGGRIWTLITEGQPRKNRAGLAAAVSGMFPLNEFPESNRYSSFARGPGGPFIAMCS